MAVQVVHTVVEEGTPVVVEVDGSPVVEAVLPAIAVVEVDRILVVVEDPSLAAAVDILETGFAVLEGRRSLRDIG